MNKKIFNITFIFVLINEFLFSYQYETIDNSKNSDNDVYKLVHIKINKEEWNLIKHTFHASIIVYRKELSNNKLSLLYIAKNEKEFAELNKYKYKIIIYNMESFYNKRINHKKNQIIQNNNKKKNLHYDHFLFYEEIEIIFKNIYDKYKNDANIHIEIMKNIGNTTENRKIQGFKFSKKEKNKNDNNKKSMLYVGMQHAREPQGMMTTLYLLEYILKNKEHKRIQRIIEEVDLYFIPIMNPDGYAYNWKKNNHKVGGGMWRKNMRRNKKGQLIGVDLNRNWGPHEIWNYPNHYHHHGSSDDPNADDYRGPHPFSEPETRAIRDFVLQHNVKGVIDFHAFSNLFLYPWGHNNTVADQRYVQIAKEMNFKEKVVYQYGTPGELLYNVRGSFPDWLQWNGIMSICIEIGTLEDGFWPKRERIKILAQENINHALIFTENVINYAK